MESKLNELFEAMWHKYDQTCFDAHRIHKLLTERGEEIENDHIAIRTFNTECMNIEVIANIFKEYGYEEKGQYYFEEKKLNAKHYELEGYPKIFISELILEEFSQELQDIVHRKITGIEVDRLNFLYNGVPLSYETLHIGEYNRVKEESEYASWLLVWGHMANHFTINVNALKTFDGLEDLNLFLKENGFKLNDSGGEIKGSKEVMLEQSSTMASEVKTTLWTDGINTRESIVIPGAYYEFAKRYKNDNGDLFQGFVTKSADKIFESTDKK